MTGNSGGPEHTIPAGPKRRGRPATGRDPLVQVRVPPDVIQAIDRWAAKFQDLDRSSAIRALVQLGLRAGRKKNQVFDPKRHRGHARKVPLAKRRRRPRPDEHEAPPASPPETRRHPVGVLSKSEINAAVERAIARSNSNGRERS